MTISILGCGWLGRPLGRELSAGGHDVKGSTTTPEKVDALAGDGIAPYLLELDPDLQGDVGDFFDADVLFLNVPPPRGRDDGGAFHRQQMEAVREANDAPWVILASSTGVYVNVDRRLRESDQPPGRPEALDGPRRSTGEVLLDVEAMWRDASADATIIRFGGLYGPERHPGRFLAGRTGISRPEAPVNLIHLDDCIGIVRAILDRPDTARGEVYNAVAPETPTRRATYTRAAEVLGLDPPSFDDDPRGGKAISSEKVRADLGYTFRHPDPSDLDRR
jgi:nucleoside-diphosphate-sugar epimerase